MKAQYVATSEDGVERNTIAEHCIGHKNEHLHINSFRNRWFPTFANIFYNVQAYSDACVSHKQFSLPLRHRQ